MKVHMLPFRVTLYFVQIQIDILSVTLCHHPCAPHRVRLFVTVCFVVYVVCLVISQ